MTTFIDPAKLDLMAINAMSSDAVVEAAAQRNWTVDQLVALNSIGWLYGMPGSYKSFLAMDLACCVSTGKQWMGRDVEQSPVLWLAAEGGDDIHDRRRAWESRHGIRANIDIQHVNFNLLDENNNWAITNAVDAMLNKILAVVLPDCITPLRDELESLESEREEHERQAREIGEAAWLQVRDQYQDWHPRDRREESERVKHNAARVPIGQARNLQDRISRKREQITVFESAIDNPQSATSYHLSDIKSQIAERYKPRLIVVDTFAQTSGNANTGPEVTEYIRRLKQSIRRLGNGCSIIVIDHTTKGGDSYMGALAKQGDSDLMAKIEKESELLAVIKTRAPHGKLKFAAEPDDIAIALESQPIHDSNGQPLTDTKGRIRETLVCTDGAKKLRLAEIAKADANSAQALLLALLDQANGQAPDSEIRQQFLSLPAMADKKPETAKQAYLRAKKALAADELITIENDQLLMN